MAFPASPTIGDEFTKRGIVYTWTGTIWRPNDYSAFWDSAGDGEYHRVRDMTQAQYDGITPKPNDLYVIVG
jgi:hypothetical protein